ncbi:MAG: SufD family Fe-S cluster assembly protein [Nitrospirota bacterium]|nr:MAG: SufD family Fe-S cluster assembly protein [Nitrospirota bacterium]
MQRVDHEKRALRAVRKRADFGPDLDIGSYEHETKELDKVRALNDLPGDIAGASTDVGIETDESCRSGTFFQINHSVVLSTVYQDGLEIMSITEALQKYDWLSGYRWQAMKEDADKFTAEAELHQHQGYFIRALPGSKVELPLQACLFMDQDSLIQNVHNIIIAEEGSELHIITGCAAAASVNRGLHIGISEFYIKKNAKMTFTMIHKWADNMAVRPRSAAIIDESGLFLSNYVCIKPVRTLQMYPTVYCTGKNSTARFNAVLVAHEGSDMDVGSRVYLRKEGSRAEVITRAISEGGNIFARGHLIGEVPDIKAHLECRGLILSEKGSIHAIPELEGKVSNVDMSHEAAVGKIAEEEIQYLMARGLSEEEATSAIVRGFLDIEVKGLPSQLQAEMKKALHPKELKDRVL